VSAKVNRTLLTLLITAGSANAMFRAMGETGELKSYSLDRRKRLTRPSIRQICIDAQIRSELLLGSSSRR
jgi:hypothetical protein